MSDQDSHKALLDKVLFLEGILNNLGAFIYSKEIDGRYTYANQLVLDLFNKTNAQVIGYDDSHFFDLKQSNQLKENDQKVIKNAVTVESEETNFIKSTNEIRTYRTVKSPILDENNRVIGICGVSTDITEEKVMQNNFKNQKHLLDAVLNNIDSFIYMKDNQRTFKYVNNKVAALFGDEAKNIIGKKETEVLPIETADHFHESDKKVFLSGEKQTIEETSHDESGNAHHFISTKIPLQLEGELPAIIGFSTDVTELYNLKEEFKKLANTEPLTKLFNRRYFIAQAEKEFKRDRRHHKNLSLMSIDIDHFKNINDKYGHPAGDKVLIEVSKCLTSFIRSEDVLARIGGEEFSILLPETTLSAAKEAAERIRVAQKEMKLTGNWQGEISLTLSIGVTCLQTEDKDFDNLFSRADKALYIAKNSGRDQVHCL